MSSRGLMRANGLHVKPNLHDWLLIQFEYLSGPTCSSDITAYFLLIFKVGSSCFAWPNASSLPNSAIASLAVLSQTQPTCQHLGTATCRGVRAVAIG